MALDKLLYTATATATGGRTGSAQSSDGALKLDLSTPRELGGAGGSGSNPEGRGDFRRHLSLPARCGGPATRLADA